jgi:DNA-binding beta-propeller fold protein YncE
MIGRGSFRSVARRQGLGLFLASALAMALPPALVTAEDAVLAASDPAATGDIRLERIIDNPTLARKKKGARLRRWITGEAPPAVLYRPYGLAWDGDSLLVADPGLGRVVRVNQRNRVSTSPAGLMESPIGVARCAPGIVVTDSRAGDVRLLDKNLRPLAKIAEGLERPTGVACDGERVFVLETAKHRVRVFVSSDRAADESWGGRGEGAGEFNFPAVAAWHEGTLWVGDTLNFRVQQLDGGAGDVLKVFGRLGDAPGDMPRIKGLAIDDGGRLWVSDAHLDLVSLFRPDGTFLAHLGGTISGESQFSFPAGIATHPDGRVAVADSLNRRIQIFRVVTAAPQGAGG